MKYIILGHENPDVDSIVSGCLLTKQLIQMGYDAEYVIPDEKVDEFTSNILSSYGIEGSNYQRKLTEDDKYYILVDHYERDVNGEIVAIVDHHPTDKKIKVLEYHNILVSSTACYIARGREKYFNKDDIRLAILATMIDTASFHSTKSRNEDFEWVKEQCDKYNLDYDKLYHQGLCLTSIDKSIEEISMHGLKKYNYDDIKFESSYIQLEKVDEKKELINGIVEYLKKYVISNDIFLFILIVHDMSLFKSKVYLIKENDIEMINYDIYASRGINVIPDVLKIIRKK